ncbi:MAG: SCP2 sterol-binding domain-containing protein [Candidatus Asgardarchaeia archaeon]
MSCEEKVVNILRNIVRKFEDSRISNMFKQYDKRIEIRLEDLGKSFIIHIKDGSAKFFEGSGEKADAALITDCNTFLGVVEREIDASQAYIDGRTRVEGSLSLILDLAGLF